MGAKATSRYGEIFAQSSTDLNAADMYTTAPNDLENVCDW